MVSVSASVNLPLHHKVQKFSSGNSSPGWSRKKGRKMVVVVVVIAAINILNCALVKLHYIAHCKDRDSAVSCAKTAEPIAERRVSWVQGRHMTWGCIRPQEKGTFGVSG